MAQLYMTRTRTGQNTTDALHPSLVEAGKAATEERKKGNETDILKVTTKEMPIRELLSGAFNRDMSVFAKTEKVRTVAGMKHPKIAKDD